MLNHVSRGSETEMIRVVQIKVTRSRPPFSNMNGDISLTVKITISGVINATHRIHASVRDPHGTPFLSTKARPTPIKIAPIRVSVP